MGAKASANKELDQESSKPAIKKLKRRKVYDRFEDNVWTAEMRSLSSKNWGAKYLLCAIGVFTTCAWVKPFKNKRALHDFLKIVNKSKRRPNKLWVDQGKEFYNSPMQERLGDNDIFIYSTHNKSQ